MARGLTGAMTTAMQARLVRPILIGELEFESDFVRTWTGYGDLSFQGETFVGGGNLIGISEIRESTDVGVIEHRLTLRGVKQLEDIALALSTPYFNRRAKIWMGLLDANMALIADPDLVIDSFMESMDVNEIGDTAVINVTVVSAMAQWARRSNELRYTDQEQQRLYPGDTSMRFATKLATKTLFWGDKP